MTKFIGASILIGASFIVLHKNPHLRANRAVYLAIFGASMLGLAALFDKPASDGIPVALYSAAMWAFSLPIIAFPKMTLKQLKKNFPLAGGK